ncbi:MAG: BNR/Asp-box repeat domain protein [Myxococcaceae bacterium]|nr:BNR/Asp-box repeat domain protein [Myxococcaceae bacterium]
MKPSSFAVPLALAVVATLTPRAASANGRFPAANQLVVAPDDPSVMTLRTTFGVLVSSDSATTFDWICERAVGYGGVEDPSLGMTSRSTIVAGTFEGLAVSPTGGCGWTFVGGGLTKQVIVDVVVRPDAPQTVLALTSTYLRPNDAGASTYANQVFRSTDGGTTWDAFGAPIEDTLVAETVEVSRSDPARLYVSGVTGAGTSSRGVLLVSKDSGGTWVEKDVPLDANLRERAPYVSAVDPTNPDRVYVRTSAEKTSRLLVTDDAGDTFREVRSSVPMLGFALSADGSKVFVGGTDGLFVASSTDLAFTQRSPIQVQCLTVAGDVLYACSAESSGFILGASTDEGATFTPKLHLHTVRGPLACPAGSTAAQCVVDWPALQEQLGGGPDASVKDAGADAGPGDGGGGKGCSCDLHGVGSAGVYAGACGLVAAGILALRRRRRRAR